MESQGQSQIAKDVEITGTIKSAGAVLIDGKLDGELICQGDVTVGQTAEISGNINSNSVIVEGSVAGNIVARDKIDMKATARVNGDIQSKRLAVEDGVTFVGKSEVNPGGSAAPVGAPQIPAKNEGKGPGKSAAMAGK